MKRKCRYCRRTLRVRKDGRLPKHDVFVVYDPILDPYGLDGYSARCEGSDRLTRKGGKEGA